MAKILYIGSMETLTSLEWPPGIEIVIPQSYEDAINRIENRMVDTAIVELPSEKQKLYGADSLATCGLNTPELLDILQRHFNARPETDARKKIFEAMQRSFG